MSYLVFARKFRPQRFEDVLGQEHVTRTLVNAIERKRIPQSFLFTGMRGVGKTTTARILAKALNCEKGPTAKPCGSCVSCEEVTQGRSLDVLEIDGASNRGIDDIRELRENVKFKPAAGRFKIYIIDEVHQITPDAFNALLKTLEEPPPHIKFIFATTEPAKVPATITSRCQRFHFRSLSVREITAKLAEIVRAEKLSAEEEALYTLARVAEGSLRDAESLLDQVASFGAGKIKSSDVVEVLGLPPDALVAKFAQAIRVQDAKQAVLLLDEAVREGLDVARVLRRLTEHFRDLLVIRVCGLEAQVIEASSEKYAELAEAARGFEREDLGLILSMLFRLESDAARSATPRITAEVGLIRIATRVSLESMDSILEALKGSGAPTAVLRQQNVGAPRESPRPGGAAAASTQLPAGEETRKSGGRGIRSEQREETVMEQAGAATATAVGEKPARAIALNEVEAVWPRVLEAVKQKKMPTGIFLSEAEPVETDDNLVVIGVPNEFRFHKEMLERPDNRRLVEETISALLSARVSVKFVITRPEQVAQKGDPALAPEIVDAALRIFEGRILKKD